MKSYLSDRYQTVCIDGELSELVHMTYSVPQGSVLGPKFYVMYTKPVGAICRKHGLNVHFYADDSQLYLSFEPIDESNIEDIVNRVANCVSEIMHWMNNNMLKLNSDKTELIVFSSGQKAEKVSNLTVKVGTSVITQSANVRNLGAFLDSRMNMESHVNSVCKSTYAQLRQIGRIRHYINDATKTLVNALVTSRLDYCNCLLYGVQQQSLNKLQLVQNTAGRIITRKSKFSHITSVLKDLHWLPVNYRINFKILTQVFKSLHGKAPQYINDMINVYKPTRNLRSANQSLTLVQPKTKLKFGDRSFSAAAPKLWNSLPAHVRDCTSLESFKRQLKTHFFVQVYGTDN